MWNRISSKQTNLPILKNNVPNVLYENRYCKQYDFSILLCGGRKEDKGALSNVCKLNGPKFQCGKFLSMLKARNSFKIAVINSDLYVISGITKQLQKLYEVESFSKKTNIWSTNFHFDQQFDNLLKI